MLQENQELHPSLLLASLQLPCLHVHTMSPRTVPPATPQNSHLVPHHALLKLKQTGCHCRHLLILYVKRQNVPRMLLCLIRNEALIQALIYSELFSVYSRTSKAIVSHKQELNLTCRFLSNCINPSCTTVRRSCPNFEKNVWHYFETLHFKVMVFKVEKSYLNINFSRSCLLCSQISIVRFLMQFHLSVKNSS